MKKPFGVNQEMRMSSQVTTLDPTTYTGVSVDVHLDGWSDSYAYLFWMAARLVFVFSMPMRNELQMRWKWNRARGNQTRWTASTSADTVDLDVACADLLNLFDGLRAGGEAMKVKNLIQR